MNQRLLTDLVNKVNDSRCRSIDSATDLLEEPEEIRALLFAVIASDVNALIDALAFQDELHPLFAALPRPLQCMAVLSLISNLVQDGKHPPPSIQGISDVTKAVQEIHAPLRFERLMQ